MMSTSTSTAPAHPSHNSQPKRIKNLQPILKSLQQEFSTFADEQYVVVAEAHGTLAAEAPDLVDTHAVGTDSGDLSALVDICTNKQQRPSFSGGMPGPV